MLKVLRCREEVFLKGLGGECLWVVSDYLVRVRFEW